MMKRTDYPDSPSAPTEHPGWIEVAIEVHPVAQEAVSAFLFDLGCRGVVLGEKGTPSVKAYLPMTERLEELRGRTEAFLRRLGEIFPEAAQSSLQFSKIQEEDWSLTRLGTCPCGSRRHDNPDGPWTCLRHRSSSYHQDVSPGHGKPSSPRCLDYA